MSPRDPMTSRRDLLRLMGPVCAGLAGAGCVPRSVRHDLRSSVEDTLRAFGATVVPGADPVAADGIRALWDPELPFVRYAGLLARALDRLAGGDFVAADEATRVAAIDAAGADGGITAQITQAGIFIAQVAVLSGAYDDAHGCPLIDFHGTSEPIDPAAQSYRPDELAVTYAAPSEPP